MSIVSRSSVFSSSDLIHFSSFLVASSCSIFLHYDPIRRAINHLRRVKRICIQIQGNFVFWHCFCFLVARTSCEALFFLNSASFFTQLGSTLDNASLCRRCFASATASQKRVQSVCFRFHQVFASKSVPYCPICSLISSSFEHLLNCDCSAVAQFPAARYIPSPWIDLRLGLSFKLSARN